MLVAMLCLTPSLLSSCWHPRTHAHLRYLPGHVPAHAPPTHPRRRTNGAQSGDRAFAEHTVDMSARNRIDMEVTQFGGALEVGIDTKIHSHMVGQNIPIELFEGTAEFSAGFHFLAPAANDVAGRSQLL